ncbi:MAG: GrpB family protein [Proteobacteria bacterium]|nr:GrpB family protein [Pseudomonadota bacterium]
MKILKYKKLPAGYKPWKEEYYEVAAALINFIETSSFQVIHIGSTSAKIDGKGIIDLSILYQEGELEQAVSHLLSLGFQKQIGDNPFPENRPRMDGGIVYKGQEYMVHIHVIEYGCEEHQKQLRFKAFMLSSPKARKDYEESKLKIISEGILDQEKYGKLKSPFVKSILVEVTASKDRS